MSASTPLHRARWILLAAVAIGLPFLIAPTASADPVAGATSITVEAEMTGDFSVVAQGVLTDSAGSPIPASQVQGLLNGEPVAESPTGEDGTYTLSFTLPEGNRSGDQEVVAMFAGQGELEPSQAAITLSAVNAAPPTPQQPHDTRLDVFIDVSVAPSTVSAGGLVTVEGTIADANRVPIQGAILSVLVNDKESPDSRVVSSESGSFQTFAEISRGVTPGENTLVVSFAGNDGFTPGFRTFTLNVEEPLEVDQESPSASPTASAESEASATATPTTDVPAEVDSDTAGRSSFLSWFYVALIVVGGTAVLVAAILVFRGKYARRTTPLAADEEGLALLLDDAEAVTEDEVSPAHAISDDDAAVRDADGSSETGDPSAPRRSFD
ncbi:MAG: carboxypeptidase-like regulatory domain-containing protein [Propionibacteriaceae bacterium]|nr:carboxypeptidase-like regulatory domain-containing protein [Propionibacteriaceae bacterium]